MKVPEIYESKHNGSEVRAITLESSTTVQDIIDFIGGENFRVRPVLGNGFGAAQWQTRDELRGWVNVSWSDVLVNPYKDKMHTDLVYVFSSKQFHDSYRRA